MSGDRTESANERQPIALTLFIAATSPASMLAIENIRSALERCKEHAFLLETVEIVEFPLRALQQRVLVTPTLFVPACNRHVVGDLNDAGLLDYFLQSVWLSLSAAAADEP